MEVSGAVRPIYGSLGIKRLIFRVNYIVRAGIRDHPLVYLLVLDCVVFPNYRTITGPGADFAETETS